MTTMRTAGALVTGTLVLTAVAATPEDAIEACRRAPTADEQIACLEAALRGEAISVPEDAGAAGPAAADSPSTSGVMSGPQPVSAESPAAAATAGAAIESPPEGIGAEQVVARNMTREQHLASLATATGLKVERYSEVPYRRLVVHLENGQVWRQITGDDQYFRVDLKRNQTVDINETSIGGYKLRLNELHRTIRVERVE